jgi:hypothetical protein
VVEESERLLFARHGIAVLDVGFGQDQIVLLGLGMHIGEGKDKIIFVKKDLSLVLFDDLTELANLNQIISLLGLYIIKLIFDIGLEKPAKRGCKEEETEGKQGRLERDGRCQCLYLIRNGSFERLRDKVDCERRKLFP